MKILLSCIPLFFLVSCIHIKTAENKEDKSQYTFNDFLRECDARDIDPFNPMNTEKLFILKTAKLKRSFQNEKKTKF